MRFVGIDPASKTGFVALDEHGGILREKELTGLGNEDPKRMSTLIDEIVDYVRKDDVICIEGFPFDTQKAMFAGGLHWGIRNALFKRGLTYYEAAPNSVKKYVNVSGWTGEIGKKKRLTGKEKKAAVGQAVQEYFGYTHKSDNVVDAYIMARIAMGCFLAKETNSISLSVNQTQVINNILNPVAKPKKKRAVKV